MSKETPDSVLRRLQKLMAIANDTRADVNEATAAAAQAANIMKKYQIEEADVVLRELENADNLTEEAVQPRLADWKDPQRRIPYWVKFISSRISELTGARPIFGEIRTKFGTEPCMKFQGYSSDVKVAVYMMEFLTATMRRLRKDFKAGFTYQTNGVSSLRSYTSGLTSGICEMLDAEIAKRLCEEMEEGKTSTSNALVTAKASAIIDKFGAATLVGISMNFDNSEAALQGYDDGKEVKINLAVSNDNNPAQLQIGLS